MKKNDSDNQISWLPIGMCIGMSVGTAIGAAVDNISLWMCIGLSIGAGLGTVIDSKKKAENKEEKQDSDLL